MANRIKKRVANFTVVSNSFLRDERISFKAKGLFCYMFSMSDDWNFTIKSIASQQFDGQSSIISALKELKDTGYISYEKHNDGTGTYTLNDEPKLENPNLGNPNLGKSTRIKKDQLAKKDKINKNVAEAPVTSSKQQKKKAMFTDEDMGLAATMYHNILAMNEGYKKPDLEMWANEFRLMREIDKRTVEGMDNFLNSLATDDDNMWVFWRGNILSPKSMRKNYDKVVSQYRRDVVDKRKAVNQNIPLADRVKALSNMKKEG